MHAVERIRSYEQFVSILEQAIAEKQQLAFRFSNDPAADLERGYSYYYEPTSSEAWKVFYEVLVHALWRNPQAREAAGIEDEWGNGFLRRAWEEYNALYGETEIFSQEVAKYAVEKLLPFAHLAGLQVVPNSHPKASLPIALARMGLHVYHRTDAVDGLWLASGSPCQTMLEMAMIFDADLLEHLEHREPFTYVARPRGVVYIAKRESFCKAVTQYLREKGLIKPRPWY